MFLLFLHSSTRDPYGLKLQSLTEETESLHKVLTFQTAQIANLEREKHDLQTAFENARTQHQEEIQELRESRSDTNQLLEGAVHANDLQKEEIDTLKRQIQDLSKKIATLKPLKRSIGIQVNILEWDKYKKNLTQIKSLTEKIQALTVKPAIKSSYSQTDTVAQQMPIKSVEIKIAQTSKPNTKKTALSRAVKQQTDDEILERQKKEAIQKILTSEPDRIKKLILAGKSEEALEALNNLNKYDLSKEDKTIFFPLKIDALILQIHFMKMKRKLFEKEFIFTHQEEGVLKNHIREAIKIFPYDPYIIRYSGSILGDTPTLVLNRFNTAMKKQSGVQHELLTLQYARYVNDFSHDSDLRESVAKNMLEFIQKNTNQKRSIYAGLIYLLLNWDSENEAIIQKKSDIRTTLASLVKFMDPETVVTNDFYKDNNHCRSHLSQIIAQIQKEDPVINLSFQRYHPFHINHLFSKIEKTIPKKDYTNFAKLHRELIVYVDNSGYSDFDETMLARKNRLLEAISEISLDLAKSFSAQK